MRIGISTAVSRLRPAPGGGGGGGGGGVTWNSANKAANVTLSGSNLIATAAAGGAYKSVVATSGVAAGEKKYWEIVLNVGGGNLALTAGVCDSTNSQPIALDAANMVYRQTYNGMAVGEVISFAVDRVANTVSYNRNTGSGWTTISSAIGGWTGIIYPLVFVYDSGDQVTARFASGSWTGSAPSGHTALT